MLNSTSIYEELITPSLTNFKELTCRLVSGYENCSNAVAGLDCTMGNQSDDRFYKCGLNIDIQNETSYTCNFCNTTSHLVVNSYNPTCGAKFKLNMVTMVFETALKTLWIRIPNFIVCDFSFSEFINCFSDSLYFVNRTLHLDSDESLLSVSNSVYENFHCLWNGSVVSDLEEKVEYDWIFLFVILFIVAGGVGNILVCLAVILDKRLQNLTNYFLLSLAIADLLVSLFVMPMGAIPGFLGKNCLCISGQPHLIYYLNCVKI